MRQAVILAGGKATRMRPYTDDRPKAMVEVAGAPILEHQLRWLAASDVGFVVLSVGYRADVIRAHVGDGAGFGLEVSYAVEDEPLGRGGGLKFAAQRLPFPDEGWLGMNGDVLCRFPMSDLTGQHHRLNATATIALAPYRSNWGLAELEGDLVRGFVQSPRLPYWINAGIYAMSPEVVALLPDKGDHEDTTFPSLALAGKLGAFKIEGYWRGIDTVKDVQEASAELLSGGV
jgi:NDP-sugar pyrophosphorylase family protein